MTNSDMKTFIIELPEEETKLFKQLLNFKYDETFLAVSKFMNFYIEGYIEDCPCEKDF